MINKFIILSLLFNNLAFATLKVAVVDTGLDLNDPRFTSVLCPDGSKDFTGKGIEDTNGHGTHIAGLIKQYAKDSDYCLLIYKFFDENQTFYRNENNTVEAFTEAIINGASIINYSAGGPYTSVLEELVIKNHPEVIFFVAAGNEGTNLDINCIYYPACYNYPNIIVIGNFRGNHGKKVNFIENGTEVISTLPNGEEGLMTGSSQSTAIHTGKFIHENY